MKLLFINPPLITSANKESIDKQILAASLEVPYPPLWIGYLAAKAQNLGHECKALDGNICNLTEELKNLNYSPDLILVSSLSLQYRATKLVIKAIKGKAPVIVGGPHASIFKENILTDGVDAVAVGEGENTIEDVLKNFSLGFNNIPGIIFKKDGRLVDNGPALTVKDLDALPFPAWDCFDLNAYPNNLYYGRRCMPVISSRGCPYRCIYCFKGVFGDTIRTRSAQNIFQEVVLLRDKYGVSSIQFQDDLFTVNRSRIEDFCQLIIDNKVDILWRCLARADQVDLKLLEIMKRAGCNSIAFGIESGNQEFLDKLGKKLQLKKVEEAIAACNNLKIVSKGYYIIGLPGETHSTVRDTIAFARKNRTTQTQFTLPAAFPGTQLWNVGKQKGLPVESQVEIFAWDNSRPPFSFSDNLTVNELEYYILKARAIGALKRFVKTLTHTSPSRLPRLFKRAFSKIYKLFILRKIKHNNQLAIL